VVLSRITVGDEAVEAKGWLGAHKWLLARRFSQISVLVIYLLGPLAGIWLIKGNLSSSRVLDTVPLTDPLLLTQMLATRADISVTDVLVGAGIVTLFYFLAGGRAFCSWVCPVNMITDAADWLRRKLGINVGSRLSRKTRYWFLAIIVLLSFATGMLAYEFINPVAWVQRGIIFGMGMGWAMAAAIFLFDLFVSKRGWCSHLCPMGAFYSLIGKYSPLRIRADNRAQCDDCNECYVICPEPQVIRPALKGAPVNLAGPVILSGDCTNCGRCIDICAEDVFHFGLRYKSRVQQTGSRELVDNKP